MISIESDPSHPLLFALIRFDSQSLRPAPPRRPLPFDTPELLGRPNRVRAILRLGFPQEPVAMASRKRRQPCRRPPQLTFVPLEERAVPSLFPDYDLGRHGFGCLCSAC